MSLAHAEALRHRAAVRRKAFIDLVRKRVRPGSGSHPFFLASRTAKRTVMDLRRVLLGVPFVVVGGLATRLYMPERATFDTDVLVRAADFASTEARLRDAGARKLGDLAIGGSSWTLPDGSALDVIASDERWVGEALAQPQEGPDGLPYVSLPYLVLMKLHASRAQDIADLSRMLGAAGDRARDQVRSVVRASMPDAAEDVESLITLGALELGPGNTGPQA